MATSIPRQHPITGPERTNHWGMDPKQISAIVTAAALATLRQLPGVDPAELESAARAIGNNAAQALVFALDTDD